MCGGSASQSGQPRLNLRLPLLSPPNLPLPHLTARLVLGRRGIELTLVGRDLARQLGALPLKGLPLVNRGRHGQA